MKALRRGFILFVLIAFSLSAKAFIPALVAAALESEAGVALVRVAGSAFSFKQVSDFVIAGMAVGGAYVAAKFDFDKLAVVNSDASTNPKSVLTIDPSYSRSRDNPDAGAFDPRGRDFTPKQSFNINNSQLFPPQSGTAICTIVSNAINTTYDTYSLSVSASSKTTYYATTTNTNPGGYQTAGSYTCSGTFYYLWSKVASIPLPSCGPGYSQTGLTCTLVDAAQVKKPAGRLPCEVIATSSGFQIDPLNPTCIDLASRLTVNKDGSLTFQTASGAKTTVKTASDGAGTITAESPAETTTIPFSPSPTTPGAYTGGGSVSIGPGVPSIPPGTTAPATDPATNTGTTSGSTTGTNTGTGTGTSTSPWLCGLTGLPPCTVAVDSTGVVTTVDALANPQASVSDNTKTLDAAVSKPDTLWPAFPLVNWAFALPSGCSVIPTPEFAPALSSIDLCQYQPMFHSVMSMVWVLGGLWGSIGLFWRNTMATN